MLGAGSFSGCWVLCGCGPYAEYWDQCWVLGPVLGAGTSAGCWVQGWVLGPVLGARLVTYRGIGKGNTEAETCQSRFQSSFETEAKVHDGKGDREGMARSPVSVGSSCVVTVYRGTGGFLGNRRSGAGSWSCALSGGRGYGCHVEEKNQSGPQGLWVGLAGSSALGRAEHSRTAPTHGTGVELTRPCLYRHHHPSHHPSASVSRGHCASESAALQSPAEAV